MMLNWKTLSFAIASICVLIVLTSMVVVSQRPQGMDQGTGGPRQDGFRGGPGSRGGLLGFARDLNLSDEQKTQISKITENFEASTKELHDQMRALHESEPNPFSTTFDEAAVRSAAEARAKIDIELQVARAKAMSQIAAVLTAEQRSQLAARRPPLPNGPPPPPPGF